MDRARILELDRRHVWHPYTPMDAWSSVNPLVVGRARGAWLEDVDGRRYLDGNSSWYVAALGHGHPRVLRALREQSERLAHVSLAGVAHEPASRLAADLVACAPAGLTRVFYTDDGSTAVDAAVKMCAQAWRQLGRPGKSRFVALDGAFHGDSVGATSLGGCEVFRRPYASVTFECVHVPVPEQSAYEAAFDAISRLLRDEGDTIAAVFVEPVVQGAGGMRLYDPAFVRALRAECTARDVWLVADEVFSGYGRTGRMWACEHAGVTPDLMCIGKAMSAVVPMGAVLAQEHVLAAFAGGRERAFLHGHTFCGNPIGAALASEVLAIYRDEGVVEGVSRRARIIERGFARIAALPGVARVRSLGMVGAADLAAPGGDDGYLGGVGWRVYDAALRRGAYLRPLGSTVYVCPPLVMPEDELEALLGILEESVREVTAR